MFLLPYKNATFEGTHSKELVPAMFRNLTGT